MDIYGKIFHKGTHLTILAECKKSSDYHIQWGFVEDMGTLSLKYAPYAIKGLGVLNRKLLHYQTDNFAFKEEWLENLDLYK